jgi:hypothetical protein
VFGALLQAVDLIKSATPDDADCRSLVSHVGIDLI